MRFKHLASNIQHPKAGFTLVELLIVIAVIGVLAAGLVAILDPLAQIKKARDTGRKSALKQLQSALEQYYNDNGVYPAVSCRSDQTATCWTLTNGASNLLGAKASTYLPSMPQDPVQTGTDCTNVASRVLAYYSATGASYILTTRLENTSDPSIAAGKINAYTASGAEPCTAHNYKVVSQQQ